MLDVERKWNIVLILVVLVLIVGFGGYFSLQMTPQQQQAEPNEVITVEKSFNLDESIHWSQFYDEHETATISITVPEMSEIQEVRYEASATAFGSTGNAKGVVSGDRVYAIAYSQDVGNDGNPDSSSDFYFDDSTYITDDTQEFSLDGEVYVAYDNSNNYAKANGKIIVTYKHLEMVNIYRWDGGDCTLEEYRSDKIPDTSQVGVYDTEQECLDDKVVMWKYDDLDCVSEEYRSDLAPEPQGDYYQTEQACLDDNFTLDTFENLWVQIKDFFRGLM